MDSNEKSKRDEIMSVFSNQLPDDYSHYNEAQQINNNSSQLSNLSFNTDNQTTDDQKEIKDFLNGLAVQQPEEYGDLKSSNSSKVETDDGAFLDSIFGNSDNDDFVDDAEQKYRQEQGFTLTDKLPYKIDTTDSKYTSQSEAFLQLIFGNNVFLSGPAGSGKSYIIDKYVDYVHKHSNKHVYVTSTTGLSALNVHGETIHSYSGQGISLEPYQKMKNNPSNIFLWKKSKRKILDTDILIIDEISMFSELQLEFLYERLKDILKERFDKIQIIVAGDFSQLPPVASKEQVKEYGEGAKTFCYNTPAWKNFHFIPCYLDRIYRAKDTRLQTMLNNIADGHGSDHNNIRLLRQLKVTKNKFTKDIPTLVSTNCEVNKINNQMQCDNPNQLYSNLTIYQQDVTSENLKKAHYIAKKMGYEEQLDLKVGDTVMVTANGNVQAPFYEKVDFMAPNLKNGIIGTIVSLTPNKDHNNMLDSVGFKANIDNQDYNYTLHPDTYEINDVKGEVLSSFKQYPLRLAYAISIHKSQGQTFSKIAIDLKNTWMPGLGYVALSRATNYDSISLIKSQPGRAWNSKALMINRSSLNIRQDLLKQAYGLRQAYMPFYEIIAKDINFIFNNRDKLDSGQLLNAAQDWNNGKLKKLKDYYD